MATGNPLQGILDRLAVLEATSAAQGVRISALEAAVAQMSSELAAVKARQVGWAPAYPFPQPPLG